MISWAAASSPGSLGAAREGKGGGVLSCKGAGASSVSLTDLHSPSEACTPEDLLIWTRCCAQNNMVLGAATQTQLKTARSDCRACCLTAGRGHAAQPLSAGRQAGPLEATLSTQSPAEQPSQSQAQPPPKAGVANPSAAEPHLGPQQAQTGTRLTAAAAAEPTRHLLPEVAQEVTRCRQVSSGHAVVLQLMCQGMNADTPVPIATENGSSMGSASFVIIWHIAR